MSSIQLIAFRYLESKLNQSDSNLNHVLDENGSLKQRLESFEQNEQTIREMVARFGTNAPYDERLKTINRTMAIYEQRLGYINKRFHVLQTLFNRQLLSLSSRQQTTIAIQTEDDEYHDYSLIERELQNVTRERDLLEQKLKQEYHLSQQRADQLENQYRTDLTTSHEKLISLQLTLHENQAKIEFYEKSLQEKDKELQILVDNANSEKRKQNDNCDSLKKEYLVSSI